MPEQKSTAVRSVNSFSHCPYCGEPLEREEQPVGSVVIDGEEEVTKTNLEVSCPGDHGVLYTA